MDQFAAMQTFVRVVETGGFSETARQLDLAVSSVTRQVNSLEALLNTQLLNRSTRSITLTPRGRQYYQKVVRILQDLEEANASVREGEDIPRGVLRVGMPVAFGRLCIAPLLHQFLKQYPEIKLELRLSDALANLVEDELDLVIRMGNLDRSGATLIVRKLADYTRLVCGSPSYFQQFGKPNHPDDLARHNCLLFAYSTGRNIWRFQQNNQEYEIQVQGSIVANHSELLRQACLDGLGLILMPTWLMGEDIRLGRVEAVLTDFTVHPQAGMDMGIYALYPSNRRDSLRVKTFIDFLIENL
ncbi:MAG: LysR substrate-binding domain-containing protein [Microcoleaceae cyanobacterium]